MTISASWGFGLRRKVMSWGEGIQIQSTSVFGTRLLGDKKQSDSVLGTRRRFQINLPVATSRFYFDRFYSALGEAF